MGNRVIYNAHQLEDRSAESSLISLERPQIVSAICVSNIETQFYQSYFQLELRQSQADRLEITTQPSEDAVPDIFSVIGEDVAVGASGDWNVRLAGGIDRCTRICGGV